MPVKIGIHGCHPIPAVNLFGRFEIANKDRHDSGDVSAIAVFRQVAPEHQAVCGQRPLHDIVLVAVLVLKIDIAPGCAGLSFFLGHGDEDVADHETLLRAQRQRVIILVGERRAHLMVFNGQM